jgi:hypothetical protein
LRKNWQSVARKRKPWTGQELDQYFLFFIFEILVKLNKIKISKISPIYTTKTKFSKNFPIFLSKIGEISPEKKTLDKTGVSPVFIIIIIII